MKLDLLDRRLCMRRGTWPRVLGILVGVVFSASIGATTVRTLTNEDTTMCAGLRRMAEAADLSHLTDEQLCTFRFAGLPEAVTKQFGFSFPRWSALSVDDATATYSRMAAADLNTHAREFDTPDQKARIAGDEQHQRVEVARMASEGILAFHKTTISVSGQSLTFEQMDWTRCPRQRPLYAGPLLYTAFRDAELRTPIPSDSSPLFAEIALWKGSVPVTIDINPANKERGNEMYLTLNVLWWHESDKKREQDGVLGGGERCVLGLRTSQRGRIRSASDPKQTSRRRGPHLRMRNLARAALFTVFVAEVPIMAVRSNASRLLSITFCATLFVVLLPESALSKPTQRGEPEVQPASAQSTGSDSASGMGERRERQPANFLLKFGKGKAVCEAYLKRLNESAANVLPYCGIPEDTQVPGFTRLIHTWLTWDDVVQIHGDLDAFTHFLGTTSDDKRTYVYGKGRPFAYLFSPPIDIENDGVPDNVLMWANENPDLPSCGQYFGNPPAQDRNAAIAVILTSDGKGIDAEKTKRVFGNKLGGIVLGTGPHKTPTFFPGYQPIGRGFNIFGYRGLFYFSTFVVVPSGYADQPGASDEAEDTFGVYLHRRGATHLMCEYTYRETE